MLPWLKLDTSATNQINQPANTLLQQRKQHVHEIANRWLEREYPKRSAAKRNIPLKIVGSSGSSYVVPMPDFERYQREWEEYDQQPFKTNQEPPILHYKNGPIIQMSAAQREQQRRGALTGCIANCMVPPIGSVAPHQRRGQFLGVQFPDADQVMAGQHPQSLPNFNHSQSLF